MERCVVEVKGRKDRKMKKSKFKIFLFVVIVILLVISNVNKKPKVSMKQSSMPTNKISKTVNVEEYSKNSLYRGIGQEHIEGKDGYDTTFTTIDGKVYKEYKQNGNASWKDKDYWGGTFEENGCGVAALATISSGYSKKYTPEELRKKYVKFTGEHLEGDQMSSEIRKTLGLENSDFLYADAYFKKNYIIGHLKENRPILICVWNKPDSKWTTSSHYMVLLATDEEDKVYVSNPNGLYGNEKMSGWYKTDEVLPYIAKALFVNE